MKVSWLWSVVFNFFLLLAPCFPNPGRQDDSFSKSDVRHARRFLQGEEQPLDVDSSPRIAIYTAPLPFFGQDDSLQRIALSSWLQLDPSTIVYFVGNHPTFFEVARSVNSVSLGAAARVRVIESIDCNYKGVPLFNSILKTAMAREPMQEDSYTMILTPDTILLKNVLEAIRFLRNRYDGFVMMAAETTLLYPKSQPEPRFLTSNEYTPLVQLNVEALKLFVDESGKRNTSPKVSFWLWHHSSTPLINTTLLPFSFQRGRHDRWLANEIAADGRRALIDVTRVVSAVRFKALPLDLLAPRKDGTLEGESELPSPQRWNTKTRTKEDVIINRMLAEEHRVNTANRSIQSLTAPLQLKLCTNDENFDLCLSPVRCPLNETIPSGDPPDEQNPIATAEKGWLCSMFLPSVSVNIPPVEENWSTEETEAALAAAADSNKTVVLVAVSGSYKDMLMSFTCNLRRLGISNMVVGALDPEIYDFAKKQGLPVFFDLSAKKARAGKANNSDCVFGSNCFQKVTKSKSKVVLNVLKLGYNVLFSDVDIVWFRDPFPEILAYPEGTFLAQSDQPRLTDFANGGNGTWKEVSGPLNSGFYFARSDSRIIEAFGQIVEHAEKSNKSEQPSFYIILCGATRYVVGSDECLWPVSNLRTIFFPRMLHPNGFYNDFWLANDTQAACAESGCATLHNNWIAGKAAKMARAKEKGFWYFDGNCRACKYE